jgi:O-antigen/teichoic acid export membrane protein
MSSVIPGHDTPSDSAATTNATTSALDRQFVRGVAWTGMSRLATQFVSWASFLLAARLLTPGDFGVVAAATSTVGLVGLITEFGLGTAIVAKANVDRRELQQLSGLAALAALAGWLVCVLIAWPASQILRVPELVRVLPLVGCTIAITTFYSVPAALLRRELAFKRLSAFEVGKALTGAATLMTGALLGWGFWAPLGADLLAVTVMMVLLLRGTRLWPKRPVWQELRESLHLSRDVLLSRVAWYSYSNSDFAIVSRRVGAAALGNYSMAWTLINLPSEKIATLLFAVTPSIFSRVRDDLPEFRRYVRLLLESMSLLLMPASAGLALVARDTVGVVLGYKWESAVPIIQALAVFAIFKSISPLSAQILVSRGNAAAARRQSFTGLAVMPLSFLFASQYGAVAVALAWTIVYPILIWFQMKEALEDIGMTMGDAVFHVGPMLLATLFMSAGVLTAQWLLRDAPGSTRLIVSVAAGGLTYPLMLLLLARQRVLAAWRFLRHRGA